MKGLIYYTTNDNTMIIRPARREDTQFIARMILAALHIEEDDNSILARRMEEFVLADNTLYSWTRCHVAVETMATETEDMRTKTALDDSNREMCPEEIPAGLCLAYDGVDYHERRMNTFTMKCSDGMSVADSAPSLLTQEDETGAGEYYVDSLAVVPAYRGHGVGRLLLGHAIRQGVALGLHPTLLVDPDNAPAVKLYTSLGFRFHHEQYAFGVMYHKYRYQG